MFNKILLLYFLSFLVTGGLPIYSLYMERKYIEMFLMLGSVLSTVAVQVVRSGGWKDDVRGINSMTTFMMLFVGLVNVSFDNVRLPMVIMGLYFCWKCFGNDKHYYFFHEVWHHLLNLTLYMVL
jgi:multisubunit Na+/H+ antiporter MnhF subunit